MARPTDERRLRLFAFTQSDKRLGYLAVLGRFDTEREHSRLQLAAADLVGADPVDGPPLPRTEEAALAALDQLHSWGLLDRVQDDRRVRTIAEYRQRRSVYQMTELGWLAWSAVQGVLDAEAGEAELRRLVLTKVGEELVALEAALDVRDPERLGHHLQELHTTLRQLAAHAARFTLATSELSSTWEADPVAFLAHKNRLLGHLDGFLQALTAHHPALRRRVGRLDTRAGELVDLATEASLVLLGQERARARAVRAWEGVVSWFLGRPDRPSQADLLEERTNRAIRDLAVLLERVLEATAGGVSRASQLELLAEWVLACPGDDEATALVEAFSGVRSARHWGTPDRDPEDAAPGLSWWDSTPAPIDMTLRKRGHASSPGRPGALAQRPVERRLLRLRQEARRREQAGAAEGLFQALKLQRPLDELELAVLLRLLTRALHARRAVATTARTTRGRLRLELVPAQGGMVVPTCRGQLVLQDMQLRVERSSGAEGRP